MKIFVLHIFLFTGLFAQSDFMTMCMNPTVSQKVTLEAIVKMQRMKYGQRACKKIEERYVKTSSDGFLEMLHLRNQNITDITPLKYCKGVKELDLSDNNIKDITPLSTLTQLKRLDISNNPITDISSLENLVQLESLSMYKIHAKNSQKLIFLINLKSLSISDQTNIFKTIGHLSNLETLYINRTNNKDICSLNSLVNLKRLSFSKNNISDISCLNSLINLEYLTITDNPIENISVVSNYLKLSSVNLSNTPIDDISVLKDLKEIKTVIVNDTQVTDASPLSGKYMSIFSAQNTPLRWCSPKTGQEIIDGVSCYEIDGTLKPWWKRLLRQ